MAEAIQEVITTWLIEKFDEYMGEDSELYTTSQLTTIKNAVLTTPNDWTQDEWTFPALGISNRLTYRDAQMHPMRMEKQLVYVLKFVSWGEVQADAIAEVEKLLTRCERTLLSIHTDLTGLVNDYNERVKRIDFYKIPGFTDIGMSQLRKYADPRSVGHCFAAQDISIVVHTITGVS